jgi:aldehyde dehydrogenase (NAD+)
MPFTFTHEFNAPAFKGKVSFNTGLFINGQFLDGSDNTTIEYVLLLLLIDHFLLISTNLA